MFPIGSWAPAFLIPDLPVSKGHQRTSWFPSQRQNRECPHLLCSTSHTQGNENAHPVAPWHTSRIRILLDKRYCGTAGEVEGIFRRQTPRRFGRRSHLSLWHGETRDGRLAHGSGYGGESPGEWLVPCKSWRVGRGMVVRAWNLHNLGIPWIELLWPVEFVFLLYAYQIMQNCRLEEWTLDPWHTFATSGWGIHFQPMKLWSTLIIFDLAWQLPSPILKCSCQWRLSLGNLNSLHLMRIP